MSDRLHISTLRPHQLSDRMRHDIVNWLRWLILGLSAALIVFISIDTFERINFIDNRFYMKFQFWVCIVFVADFFIELWLADKGTRIMYLKHRWWYLALSIPYLSILAHFDVDINHVLAYLLRFMPLIRGLLALVIVYNYLTRNVITTVCATYVSMLVTIIYFGSLVFFEREMPVNQDVVSFWDALWWGASQATTLGCSIYPVTVIGKIISVVLTAMGMLMFPLFTVYVSNLLIRRHTT